MNSLINLAAFRSALSITSSVQMRAMATKAAAASAATTTTKAKTTKDADKKKTAKKTTKSTKQTKDVTAKKAEKPVKPVKIAPVTMPKRPLSGWNLFYMEHLDKARAAGRKIVPMDETPLASRAWKALSDAEKQVYNDRHKAAAVEYNKKIQIRLDELTPADFKLENTRRQALRAAGKRGIPNLKDPNAPKRPLSSFFRYAQDQRAAGTYSDLPLREQAKAFAVSWGGVDKSVKERYANEARKEQEQYKLAKAAYEANN
ncbi:exp1-like protein [Podila humilis]|nr:exp1-like protein [Podila humilis]